jgi:F0F1-type ATP synthase assembly protein I
MPGGLQHFQETGRYFALAQVGMEMVAPIAVGMAADYYLDSTPWGVAAGAVLGLVGGLWHLIVLAKRIDEADRSRPKGTQK